MILEELVLGEERSDDVGRNLRTARAWRGLSQEALAKLAGVDPATVTFVETGKTKPYRSTLGKLAAALDVPVALLEGKPRG